VSRGKEHVLYGCVSAALNVCAFPMCVLVACTKMPSGVQVSVLLQLETEFSVAAYT